MNTIPLPPPIKRRSNTAVKIIIGYLVLSLFAIVFFAGYVIGNLRTTSLTGARLFSNIIQHVPDSLKDKNVDYTLFWNVWSYISDEYVKQPVSETDAFYGSLKGMVASLGDPYSMFLDPSETKEFNFEISGRFEGIGAEIGTKDGKIVIIAPVPGSPAEKAGLKAGDTVLQIDETDTAGLTVDQAVALIRGEKGSAVKLTIERTGGAEPFTLTITRDTIITSSVTSKMLEGNIAYISLADFSQDTASEFSKAVNDLLLQEPKGLVLDLRNNPGGYLDQAVAVAGEFINNDTVVIEQFSNGQKRVHKSDGQSRLKDLSTVVLIDGGSASAAEILAGALQDYKAATLVGEQTFGKGSVQDYTEFDDGSSLKITVAEWLTPLGRSIDKTGISPDITVTYTQAQYDAGQDPQLDKAKEILSAPTP
ncbi:MAG: S41 family peptidase [Patescibacteria group bacterium]